MGRKLIPVTRHHLIEPARGTIERHPNSNRAAVDHPLRTHQGSPWACVDRPQAACSTRTGFRPRFRCTAQRRTIKAPSRGTPLPPYYPTPASSAVASLSATRGPSVDPRGQSAGHRRRTGGTTPEPAGRFSGPLSDSDPTPLPPYYPTRARGTESLSEGSRGILEYNRPV